MPPDYEQQLMAFLAAPDRPADTMSYARALLLALIPRPPHDQSSPHLHAQGIARLLTRLYFEADTYLHNTNPTTQPGRGGNRPFLAWLNMALLVPGRTDTGPAPLLLVTPVKLGSIIAA